MLANGSSGSTGDDVRKVSGSPCGKAEEDRHGKTGNWVPSRAEWAKGNVTMDPEGNIEDAWWSRLQHGNMGRMYRNEPHCRGQSTLCIRVGAGQTRDVCKDVDAV